MRGGIDDQRMPAEMGRRIFEHSILVGRFLLDYGHVAHRVCRVNAPQYRVIARAVHAGADGQNRDNFSGVRVEHNEMLAAAGRKQAMVRGVKSKPGRPFAGGELVTLRYRLLQRVYNHELTGVFEVLINGARCGVRLRVLRLSAELNVGGHLLRGGVDQRSRFAVMIAGINQIQLRVVNNGVRIDARGNLLQEPLRIQVEYPDGIVSAVARESEVATGDDGDAMCVA